MSEKIKNLCKKKLYKMQKAFWNTRKKLEKVKINKIYKNKYL